MPSTRERSRVVGPRRRVPDQRVILEHAGLTLDDDPARVDRDVLWAFLSVEAYWGRWRTRAQLDSQLDASWRVVGAYDLTGAQVGFARAVSDGVSSAYLGDVFVLPAARGRGLATALVRMMLDTSPPLRWMLHTADAHPLYRKLGFAPPDHTFLERPRPEG